MSEAQLIGDTGASSRPGAPPRGSRPQRLLKPTPRADMVVTWHHDRDEFVLTLWHDQECVGSAPLSPSDAADLSSFLITQLGDRPAWLPQLTEGESARKAPARRGGLLARLLDRVRRPQRDPSSSW